MVNKLLQWSCMFVLLCSAGTLRAKTAKFRLSYRASPSTSIIIGWEQVSGQNPVVYYDTLDHGQNEQAYRWRRTVDAQNEHKGMQNRFCFLSDLKVDQAYYFLIHDSEGNSLRYWFKTISDDPEDRLSLIAGGDTRSNRPARQRGNRLVAKLRPHAVLFGGDFTSGDSETEWRAWMDDWQLTTTEDGRMIPIVAARGNHEYDNRDIAQLFGIASVDAYYALDFGGSLLRTYTLNSEISQIGDQADWLSNDLRQNEGKYAWMFAQYHRPCRPHVSFKPDQVGIYESWIPEFEAYGIDLVIECDAHVVKRTWPIRKGSRGLDFDEGFYRDDSLGVTYIGEGTWAPLRTIDADKNWTRNSGSFNAFKWIWVSSCRVDVRTIATDNESDVEALDEAGVFQVPDGLDVWSPSNGAVLELNNPACEPISLALHSPTSGTYFPYPQPILISPKIVSRKKVAQVKFFVNEELIATVRNQPFEFEWAIPTKGIYQVHLKLTTEDGFESSSASSNIYVGQVAQEFPILSSADDAEERSDGTVLLYQTALGMVGGSNLIGLRFGELAFPAEVNLLNAELRFVSAEAGLGVANLLIEAELGDDPLSFSNAHFNLSNRPRTLASVIWMPENWVSGKVFSSPDLTPLVEEVVNQTGWEDRQSLAFLISGIGQRVALSFDGLGPMAPTLWLKYELKAGEQPLAEIRSFSGLRYGGGQVDLDFDLGQVLAETRIDILRSENGEDFSSIGSLEAALFVSEKSYHFEDFIADPHSELYYRLRLINQEGLGRYSETIQLKTQKLNLQVKIYPVPATDYLYARVTKNVEIKSVSLCNVNGQIMKVSGNWLGGNTYVMDVRDLPAGVYFVGIQTKDGLLRKRIMVQAAE